MKVLKKIDSSNVIGIDIETVRFTDTYEELDEGTQSAWRYKNKQDGVVPSEEELAEKWQNYASLYAEFSKICAVSLAFMHKDELYCKEFFGEDEVSILENLYNTLENIFNKSKDLILVGHASKYFDYPFMSKRYIINGMEIPQILDVSDRKPWEQSNLDTNDLWRNGGTGLGSSLQALCNVLQIPISKVDLVGDGVGKAFFDKEYARIGRYCSLDSIATFNIIRKFKRESIFQFDQVKYVAGFEKKEETCPMKALYDSDYLSDDIKEQIKTTFKKKRATKKDKEFIQDLLENVYVKTTFMKSDTPDIIQSKKAEIEEFLKSI